MNRQEFEQLYSREWANLRQYCQRLGCPNPDAEDCAQNAFLILWKNRRRVKHPVCYLYYAAKSEVRKAGRQARRLNLLANPDHVPNPDGAAALPNLDKLVALMPQKQRWILTARFYENQTQAEIGDTLGCSQRHAGRLIADATNELRTRINESFET